MQGLIATVVSRLTGWQLGPDPSLLDDDDEEGESLETILLGHIVRFAGDRRHPDDLAAEAVDVLHKILTGGPLTDANSKAIDDLLNNL